jgi:hypothetical protein
MSSSRKQPLFRVQGDHIRPSGKDAFTQVKKIRRTVILDKSRHLAGVEDVTGVSSPAAFEGR